MTIALDTETRLAAEEAQDRSAVYAFLSLALLHPEGDALGDLRAGATPLAAALGRLTAPDAYEAALGVARALEGCDTEALAARHERVLNLDSGCLPYETEYDQAHIFQKSQQLADVTGFYRAFGLEIAPDLRDRADHISVELEFMHVLAAKEAFALTRGHGADKVALCRAAQRAFLESHLGAWGPSLGRSLAHADPQGFYGAVGRLLESFSTAEVAVFTLPARGPLGMAEAEEELDPACETCPLVTGTGI